jgi:gliding motility-associated-like protein
MRARFLSLFFALSISVAAFAQSGVKINVLTPDVCIPGKVSLSISNCGNCVSYEWQIDSGSGYKQAGSNYSTIITDTGWYDVAVRIRTIAGSYFPVIKQRAFYGRQSPVARFSLSDSVFCGKDDTVVIKDITKGKIVSRTWIFDGQVYQGNTPTVKLKFGKPYGYKSVFLYVRDTFNCQGQHLIDSAIGIFDSIRIDPLPDKIKGCAPALVNFNASLDTGLQHIQKIQWSFPKATPALSSARYPAGIRYAKGDTFDVFVTINTKEGCNYRYKYNNLLSFGDTALLKITASSTSVCIRERLDLKVSGSKNLKPDWIIGPKPYIVLYSGDTFRNIRFTDTGLSSIRVVEDNNGCISEALFGSNITAKGPIARFESDDAYFCNLPVSLDFKNRSVEAGSMSYNWSIRENGGAVVKTGGTKDISYSTNLGISYDAELIASSSNGCADTLSRQKAAVYGKIESGFLISPRPACPGTKVKLMPDAGSGTLANPNIFKWSFYDDKGNVVKTSGDVAPYNIYNNQGIYSAKLIISNANGCKDSLMQQDSIWVRSPKFSLNIPDTFVCLNELLNTQVMGRPRGKSFLQLWAITNIDSVADVVYGTSDTFAFSLRKTGRWRVKYTLRDTSGAGCVTEATYPKLIKVSGINVRIDVNPKFGCAPLTTTFSSSIKENVNYEIKRSLGLLWDKPQSSAYFFGDSTRANPTVKLPKGQHSARLIFTNESGCNDSTGYIGVRSGVVAGFNIPEQARCVGKELNVYSNSSDFADGFEYFTADPDIEFVTSRFIANPVIKFKSAGNHYLSLIASHKNQCRDTFTVLLTAYQVFADFYTPDSIAYCAPRVINFLNTSTDAVTNYWSFGDGQTGVSYFNNMAGNLYFKNRKSPGYDVQLICENVVGCRDTLQRKGYIRIVGPIPDFTISGNFGCEPLQVTFTNKSTDFKRVLLDYDDGEVLDSNLVLSHKYKVSDKSVSLQYYKPRLLLYDSLGCSALAISSDTVKVKKNAEAEHIFASANFLRNNEGCANDLLVKFSNRSSFYSKIFWDLNNDWNLDFINQSSITYAYTTPGIYQPVIIAEHVNGCRDTFRRDTITVWDYPVANWKNRSDTTCATDPLPFINTTASKYAVKEYNWNFGEISLYDDTSHTANPTYKYTTPFNHLVRLEVVDIHGCKDEELRNIYVNDTAGPLKPALAFVTVRDNQYLDFHWQRSKLGNYLIYHVALDSLGLHRRYSSGNRNDTSFSKFYGTELANRRFCYTMNIEDTCNQDGRYAVSHCSIVLRDTAEKPFNINLNWLSYDGWVNNLSHYEIFRSSGGGAYKRIAIVGNTRQSYTDSFLCDSIFCYYVESVHRNLIWRSRSNTVCRKPIYVAPDSSVITTLATVKNGTHTEVFWQPYYKYYRNWSFELQRSSNGMPGTYSKLGAIKSLSYEDFNANVTDRVNYYRVLFKDHCGVLGRPGMASNTILLESVGQSRSSTSLKWNAYGYWHAGVREYGLQLKNTAGVFQTYKLLGPNTRKLDSIDLESLELDSICFRVFAVKDSITADTSWSNEVCMVPGSYVHVPNAFTPNGNNLNEVFKPMVAYVHRNSKDPSQRFEFRILNRWGQVVYESDDANQGWDGKFMNAPAAQGLYIWTLQAVGFDGVAYRLNGTVFLMQ